MREDRNNIIDIDDLMDDEEFLDAPEGDYDDEPIADEERPHGERRSRAKEHDRADRRRRRRADRYDDDYDDAPARPRRRNWFMSYAFPFVVLAILIVASALFLREWLTYKAAGDEYALVKEKIVIPETPELEEEEEFTYPQLEIDFDALIASNPEFVCVLYIPALDLYYPVAQAEDNSKYLTTTFEGTTNPSGCIFLDCAASPDFSDFNTFIYGHNMKNETMFGSLKEFSAQEDLCAANPYFYVYFADGTVNKYHIFSYYTTPVNDALYNSISNETAYDAYIMRAQSRSYYAPTDEEADDFTLRPNLVTLSTCWGNDHKNNFVVHGALRAIYNAE